MEKISLRQTIRQIMAEHLNKNNGLLFGECVSDPGGVAGTIPESKNVIDLPMTELGGADIAVGSAFSRFHVDEWQSVYFFCCCS